MAGLLEEMEEMAGGTSFPGGNYVTFSGSPPYGSSNVGIQLNPPMMPPIPPSGVPQASLIDSINGQIFGSPRIFGSTDPFFSGVGSPPMPPVPPTPPAGAAPPGSPPNMPMSYPGVMPMMPFAPGGAGIFGFSSGMPPAPPMFSMHAPEKVDGTKVVKVLSTAAGSVATSARKVTQIPDKKEIREWINDENQQEIPFWCSRWFKFFGRGAAMGVVLFFIYWYLVPHTWWRSRQHFNVGGNIQKMNIVIEQGDYWRPNPYPFDTDQCVIKLVNPCTDTSLDCSKSSVMGYAAVAGLMNFGQDRIKYKEVDDTATVTVGMNTIYTAFPETWHNKMFCDIWVIVPPSMDLDISGARMALFTEDQKFNSVNIHGVNENAQPEFLDVRFSRVSFGGSLTIYGGPGGIMLEDVTVKDVTTIKVRDGSADITTRQELGAINVESQNRAVCLVGNRAASVRTSEKFITGGNGTTAAVYSGKFSCTTGSCANIIATSEGSGSIGVHVIGTTNTSDPLQDIFAGSAFKSNEVDGDGIDRYYTEGDYSLINNGKTDYSYLTLKGNGLMKGGVELVWSTSSVWWSFFGGDISLFNIFSFFVVMPKIESIPVTLSFCPAHENLASKEMFSPVREILSQIKPPDDAESNTLFRNNGAIRDAMKPKGSESSGNFFGSAYEFDEFIPPCAYCADFRDWKDGYWVGAFGDPVTEAPRSCNGLPKELCANDGGMDLNNCRDIAPNAFSLVQTGQAKCMPGVAVAGLMSQPVSFPDDFPFCWTMAVSPCNFVEPLYEIWIAMYFVVLSWLIAFAIAGWIIYHFFNVFMVSQIAKSILGLLVRHPEMFDKIRKMLQHAEGFAVEYQAPLKEDDEELGNKELLTRVDLHILSPHNFNTVTLWDWLKEGSFDFKKFPGWRSWGVSDKEATVAQFGQNIFIKKIRWLRELEVDKDTLVITDKKEFIKKGSKLLWLPKRAAPWDGKKVLPSGTMEKIEKHKLEFWGDYQAVEDPKEVMKEWEVFQEDVAMIAFVFQRIHMTYDIWYLLEKGLPTIPVKKVDPEIVKGQEPYFPYFALARELYMGGSRSGFGEFLALFIHWVVILTPCFIAYLAAYSYFTIRVSEFKAPDIYPGGGNFYVNEVIGDGIVIGLFTSWLALLNYYFSWSDWGLPIATGKFKDGPPSKEEKKEMYYKADKQFKYQFRARRICEIILALLLLSCVWWIAVCSIWFLFGMFLNPQKVAPYLASVIAVIVHIASLYEQLNGKYTKLRQGLRQRIIEFEENERQKLLELIQADGHLLESRAISDDQKATAKVAASIKAYYHLVHTTEEFQNLELTTDLLVISWLDRFGINMARTLRTLAYSTLIVIGVLVFLFLGMFLFGMTQRDTTQAIVDVIVIFGAVFAVNSQSGGMSMGDHVEEKLNKIMEKYKKERKAGGFAIDLNEPVTQMVMRASKFQMEKYVG